MPQKPVYSLIKMLYMTVWAIKHRTFVNNFAYETAEINIDVKHLLFLSLYKSIREPTNIRVTKKLIHD